MQVYQSACFIFSFLFMFLNLLENPIFFPFLIKLSNWLLLIPVYCSCRYLIGHSFFYLNVFWGQRQRIVFKKISIELSTATTKQPATVEPDLTATEMLAFASNSERNKNDSDSINEKTTPIKVIMSVISIASYNNSSNFSVTIFAAVRPLLSNPLLQEVSLTFHCGLVTVNIVLVVLFKYECVIFICPWSASDSRSSSEVPWPTALPSP